VSSDPFAKLEQRIDAMLKALDKARSDNEKLREANVHKQQKIEELQTQKKNLNTSTGSRDGDSEVKQEKLHAAADKLETIITRLESVG
jgi:predicted  nucleic acid-binding Zn-ribbon protein